MGRKRIFILFLILILTLILDLLKGEDLVGIKTNKPSSWSLPHPFGRSHFQIIRRAASGEAFGTTSEEMLTISKASGGREYTRIRATVRIEICG